MQLEVQVAFRVAPEFVRVNVCECCHHAGVVGLKKLRMDVAWQAPGCRHLEGSCWMLWTLHEWKGCGFHVPEMTIFSHHSRGRCCTRLRMARMI